jgi:hypothetical protein
MPPRMIDARGLLDRVAADAPTYRDRKTLDKAYARKMGCAPRSLLRALRRAEERGTVSVKVADSLYGFFGMHRRCERCDTWFPRQGWSTRCCICRRVSS